MDSSIGDVSFTHETWMHHTFDLYLKYKGGMHSRVYKCFCDYEAKQGISSRKIYSVNGVEHPICKQYFDDMDWSFIMQNSISFVTISVNFILKEIIIRLTKWVGYETYSKELTSITKGIFLAQFFNTGCQMLIVNANMQEHSDNWLIQKFDGPFRDYNPEWYNNVGDLIL